MKDDELKLPGDDEKRGVSFARIAIWVIVGGIGAYLLLSGVIGIISKG